MERRAEPERHDASCRKSGGSEARIPEVCLPCVWRERKQKNRRMIERRAEPERHDVAGRKSGGCEARMPTKEICLPCVVEEEI